LIGWRSGYFTTSDGARRHVAVLTWTVRGPVGVDGGRCAWIGPAGDGSRGSTRESENTVAFVLWILAVILVVAGIVALFRKQLIWGIVLIVVGLLVGPGGVSMFT
jgi:hypothetical protein